jgi:hypothetical protein
MTQQVMGVSRAEGGLSRRVDGIDGNGLTWASV